MLEVLPETKENVLVVEAKSLITSDDYKQVFLPKLDEMLNKYETVDVIYRFSPSYEGYEWGAMWQDAKYGMKNRDKFGRIALVGAPKWMEVMMDVIAPLIKGDVKSFSEQEFKQALLWIYKE